MADSGIEETKHDVDVEFDYKNMASQTSQEVIQSEHHNEQEFSSELDALRAKVRAKTDQLKAEAGKTVETPDKGIVKSESVQSENTPKAADDIVERVMDDEPLPTEDDLDNMLSEIKNIEQEELLAKVPEAKPVSLSSSPDELQDILSSIPSFADMNKK